MENKNTLPKYIFNWKGALVLIGGGTFPILVLSTFVAGLMIGLKRSDIQYSDFYLIFSNMIMWLGAIAAFDFLICRPDTGKSLNFNFSTVNFSSYALIFPMLIGMMFLAEAIANQIPTSGFFFDDLYKFYSEFLKKLSNDPSTMILMAVIMAPIFEEIVFRGIIQQGLINRGMKPQSAIWFAAIIFGLVHGNPWQFVGAVLLGFVMGTVYFRTQSLLLPMLMHGFNNLASTLLITYTSKESFAEAFHLSEGWLFVIGLVIFSLFYYLFMKKYKVIYSYKS